MRGFSTNAIHAGQEPDPSTGAVIVPIHPSSTFAQDGVGGLRSAATSTPAAPTRRAPRCRSASRRSRAAGTPSLSAPGWAPPTCCCGSLLRPGDHIVIPHDAYGGTFRLVDKVLVALGRRAHAGRPRRRRRAAGGASARRRRSSGARRRRTRCWASPTSRRSPSVAHDGAGARLVVDNTFASPYLQQPLALGADVVLHSTTKYVGGHSDVVGGALVTSDDELAEQLAVPAERRWARCPARSTRG